MNDPWTSAFTLRCSPQRNEGSGNFFYGNQLSVAGLPYDPNGYDVIMGMDLIGIFHTTVYGNRIILSN